MPSYITDDDGWTAPHADTVQETEKPTHSKVLGPNGQPLKYQPNPVGFNLTKPPKGQTR